MTKEDLKRDKYYRSHYGITLIEYDSKLAAQKECCAICKKNQSEFKRRLHVDHDHAWIKVKVLYEKNSGQWDALAHYLNTVIVVYGKTKAIASRMVKSELKRRSVRGLLCWPCNRGLQKWRDNPTLMENAAHYLRKHQNA